MMVHPQPGKLKLEPIGDGDGAWVVPVSLINPDWICYCVGVGVNATFDFGLAKRFGCKVYSFDPTPRSIKYMAEHADRDRVTFLPVGVWKTDEVLKFYAPANRNHANWSTADLHGTAEFFTANCKRLSTLMRELKHDHIDLLKLDIEGSWEPVLYNMIAEKISVGVLCVEFDSPTSISKALQMVKALRAQGMEVVYMERENFVFISRSLLGACAGSP